MKPIKAHFDGTKVVFDEPVNLKPNTKLSIIIHEEEKIEMESVVSEPNDLLSIFGKPMDMGIEDLSVNIDHYLYGTPKLSN